MSEWQQTFKRSRTGECFTSLQDLYLQCSADEQQLSAEFYERYPRGGGTDIFTPFRGILQQPGPLARGEHLVQRQSTGESDPQEDAASDLENRLSPVLDASLPERYVAVAVSGGIDSWLLAALLKRRGYQVCGWYLETGVPGYCEREQVERSSRLLDIECRFVHATVRDFIDAAAAFTAAVQWPIYNLHPISKWLLAQALRHGGVQTVVTGDAADQIMRWKWDCDLLPLTLASFHRAGIRMVAPFAADHVIRFCRRPYEDKQPVRELARRLGVPVAAKQPTVFPSVALPPHPRPRLPYGRGCNSVADEQRTACLAYTTGLLLQAFAGS